MLYVILALVAALLALRWLSPKSYLVHAGLADHEVPTDQPKWVRWTAGELIRDENGAKIDLSHAFYGVVDGNSMQGAGLMDGASFIGERVDIFHPLELHAGDIVVAKEFDPSVGPQKYCYCLRSVRSIENGKVQYEDSIHGSHDPHDFEQIIARVSYVLDPTLATSGVRALFSVH